ncbi:gamma-glutamyltransferase family protein [Engelhardtia mirabilis]|uniref:Gamma-glutamyltransferase YwrD n=1 Tax=Engelhardtia mirabilis TaxID=2528011 RepID=A0A518BHX3_9BACT|nr:Putative gamma-glutamyltransferase YwrD [Planctomycetes bacterium Pla133]QDV00913.1 Putative gamma-glutamyltransferase YwrD [Planctomycetes bacterium Pla86]
MDRPIGRPFAARSTVYARGGVAATSQPLATQTAIELLRRGGSAVDAAIGANAVLGLVEPTGSGVGGDLFALVWDAENRKLSGYNGSGRSPLGLSREHLLGLGLDRIPAHGPLSVSTPGCVDGWVALHERFGRLPLADLLEPAIAYAREGFPVSPVIAHEWAANARRLGGFDGFRSQFMPGGAAPQAGQVFSNPNLARTYRRIATHGREGFYRGDVPERIEAAMRAEGGFLCARDLAEHRGEWVEPVGANYRGVDVWQIGPNTQGIATLQMLGLLEHFALDRRGPDDPRWLHLLVEAKKLAYADRARWYADPDQAEIPVAELVSKDYAAARVGSIDELRAATDVAPGDPRLDAGDTVYLAIGDGDGNFVSLIQSNFRGMGSGIAPEGLGFVLQDRGELFDLAPGRPNTYAPGKRPFHTIMPGFATRDGEPWMSFGVMGGAMQPQGQVQILVGRIDFGLDLQEAGDAPRALHEGGPEPTGAERRGGGRVYLESGFSQGTVRDLLARGHRVGAARGVFGGYQAVGWDPVARVLSGASESRKDGHAAGF